MNVLLEIASCRKKDVLCMFCEILVALVPSMFLCLVRFTEDVATSLQLTSYLQSIHNWT